MNEASISHSVAWSLIPWLVNGTIVAEDRQRLEQHLGECEECHAQFLLECRVYDSMRAGAEVDDESHAALARLFERMDAEAIASPASTTQPRMAAPASAWGRWLAAAVIVQAIGLAALGTMYFTSANNATPSTSAEYRTLSRPAAGARTAVIRFVPAPDMSVATMHAVLATSGLRIVESSPHSAIFGLALAPVATPEAADARIAEAVRTLSARPDVLFAEPILPAAPAK